MALTDKDTSATPDSLVPDQNPERPQAPKWETYAAEVSADWQRLLSSDPEEREVQSFLQLHPSMIPGGDGDVGPGGHHGSEMLAVFGEPELTGAGRGYEPDFMWVTRSTSLITPILIEIEKPSKRWFKKNGRPTGEFRDAHAQLNDWRSWFSIDENRALFRQKYLFFDRYESRPIEPQFVLIYGRQSEFENGGGHRDPGALRRKRDTQRRSAESFQTFDSLRPRYNLRSAMTVKMTAEGPLPFAFSPTYGTDAKTGKAALLLGDASQALARSVMTDGRKDYLAGRWEHWRRTEFETQCAQRNPIRHRGYE
ncbi:Shedu anti-phage system protein SduA domain-containing protein [Rhodococcus opacus]|uniref:Shedu anti-phage system protein SduA domain-containing protein n=1 Tax=Rhodococcus opacus TaxID=37919 RepID=UPI00155A50EC|nr:Shedu anti-phage system protein SduA domain-containing protein [Rhodococcus opacus]